MKYWENASVQEQRTLKRGLVVIAVMVVVRFVWWPLFSNVDRFQEDINNERHLIAWMQPIVTTLQNTKTTVTQRDHEAPRLSTIEKSFAQAGLSPFVKSLSQNANQQIVLQAQSIPFGALAQCLESIATMYGIVPLALTATRQKTGIVDAEIVF